MKNKKILLGICGSFCNHANILIELEKLVKENDVQVIVSENVYLLDTRFHSAKAFIEQLENLTNKKVWHTLTEVEMVGPLNTYDIYAIAPLSASALSKLCNGIYDHPITLCAKAMLRNNKNVVIGIASNDVLSISGKNLMNVLNFKNIYCIPFFQDDPFTKPNSIISEWTLLEKTMDNAYENKQIQPLLLQRTIL